MYQSSCLRISRTCRRFLNSRFSTAVWTGSRRRIAPLAQRAIHVCTTRGDGRVHTDIVSRSTFVQRARLENVRADPEKVFGHLTDSDVLVLRRLSIPSVSRDAEEPICCLGHDVIGLALDAMKVTDESAAAEGRSQRIWFAVAAAFVATAIGVGLWLWPNVKYDRKVVAESVAESKRKFKKDPNSALEAAIRAHKTASEVRGIGKNVTDIAAANLAALLPAWPIVHFDLNNTPNMESAVVAATNFLKRLPTSMRSALGTRC